MNCLKTFSNNSWSLNCLPSRKRLRCLNNWLSASVAGRRPAKVTARQRGGAPAAHRDHLCTSLHLHGWFKKVGRLPPFIRIFLGFLARSFSRPKPVTRTFYPHLFIPERLKTSTKLRRLTFHNSRGAQHRYCHSSISIPSLIWFAGTYGRYWYLSFPTVSKRIKSDWIWFDLNCRTYWSYSVRDSLINVIRYRCDK